MNKNDIIIVSADEWNGIPRLRHQVASYFSNENRILFIENPRISFFSIIKDFSKLKFLFKINRIKQYENVLVYTPPPCLPFWEKNLILNKINNYILRSMLRKRLKQIKFKNIILWCFYYNHSELIGEVGEQLSIYTAHDVWEEVAGRPKKITEQMEKELITQVDIAIFTAKNNYDEKKEYNENCYYISHGAPKPTPYITTQRPNDLPKGRKIIGYWGVIDDTSIDMGLLLEIAEKEPLCNIVLIGLVSKGFSRKLELLLSIENIYYLSMKKKEQMAEYLKWFDVGIIPYLRTPFRLKCSPLKIYDYFSVGIPVVSIDNREVLDLPIGLVYVASNKETFLKQIKLSMSESYSLRKKRIEYCSENTWDHKLEIMKKVIEQRL